MRIALAMFVASGLFAAEKKWEYGTVVDVREITETVGTVVSGDTQSSTQTYGQFGRTQTTGTATASDVKQIRQGVFVRTKTLELVGVRVVKYVWQKRAVLTVGGPVMLRIDGRNLYVIEADDYAHSRGKELKLELVRKERLPE